MRQLAEVFAREGLSHVQVVVTGLGLLGAALRFSVVVATLALAFRLLARPRQRPGVWSLLSCASYPLLPGGSAGSAITVVF